MIAQINMRKGTSAEWAAASPVVLLAGESGYDTTLKRFKVGDGETEWANLEWNTLWSRPVGCIYESTVSTPPATLFGGTWAAMGGTFLLGADGTYAAGSTGGAATHAHTLDAGYAKMSGFNYGGSCYLAYKAKVVLDYLKDKEVVIPTGTYQESNGAALEATELGGSTDAGSSMPPYEVVYRWKRTA